MNTDNYAKMVSVSDIHPYENNPRDNSKSIPKVAESIKTFGFLQPIVCDGDGTILAGHTRYQAALSLGMKEVPVVYASDLTPAQARAYRLADNKVSEGSLWIDDLLTAELDILKADDPCFEPTDFGFESTSVSHRKQQWQHIEKRCNLERCVQTYLKCEFYVTTFFHVSNDGISLSEIKSNSEMVRPFADVTCDYITGVLGGNLSDGGWCICTTPRRRHNSGFHFSTEVSQILADELNIPFYADAVISHNKRRITTNFTLGKDPKERNVILFDDIITTGVTLRDTRNLLVNHGHNVFSVVAIKN